MSGLLNFLSSGLTTATNAASSYAGAKAGVAKQQHDDAMQQAMLQAKLLKEKHDQEIMDALRRSQTDLNNQRGKTMKEGKPPGWQLKETEDGYQWFQTPTAPGDVPQPKPPTPAEAPAPTTGAPPTEPPQQGSQQSPPAQQPPAGRVVSTGVKGKKPVDPLATKLQARIAELTKTGMPLTQARDKARDEYGQPPAVAPGFTFPVVTDSTGRGVIAKGNTKTGEIVPTSIGARTTGGGSGATPQNIQARLIGAVSEGRLADERMTKYEKGHLKNGKLQVGFIPDIAAGFSTGLAGAHNPISIALQKVGTRAGNATDPDYLQYQRDARLTARAEQLMAARGGSEAMASDNAFLAQGGAGAPEATVRAAQKSRRALFGKLGAVMQTLTPEQITKLNAGLDALHDDKDIDYGAIGKDVFGPGGVGSGPAPAGGTPAGKKPTYEEWLKSQKP